jgi:protein-disulfide isomerase
VTKKQLLILLAAFVLIAGGLAAWLIFGEAGPAAPGAGGTDNAGFALLPTDRTLGDSKAKVTLIEYAAPTCPVCAAFNANTFEQFKKAYVDTGKVYYVFRVFNLRPDDAAAEKIARCLPEDKYFSFIDLLFRNQPLWDWEYGVVDVHGGLVRVSRMAGLSADQVDKCIDNKAEDERINKVQSEAESRYGISSTPTFILDGTSIGSGAFSFDQLSQMLDAEIAKKK